MSRQNNKQVSTQVSSKRTDAGTNDGAWTNLFLAWVISMMASLGVIFIGEITGQLPCIMCWFQRAFMFPLSVILGIAAFRSDFTVWRYSVPLAGIGALFAFYHSLLYSGVIAETLTPCSQGVPCTGENMTIFGLLPLPLLSFGSFFAIAALTYFADRKITS